MLRAINFARLSVWPRFGSKTSGILASIVLAACLVIGSGALPADTGGFAAGAAAALNGAAGCLSVTWAADTRPFCDERLAAAIRLPPAFTLVILFNPASTPTSRTITDKIESDNLPVRCPMI